MQAAVAEPFDYLVPAGTPEGALVEASLAGRSGVGVVWNAHPPENKYPASKLKPINTVLDLAPLPGAYRKWLEWVAEFTLSPRGAVLGLCGLPYAAKPPKRKWAQPSYTISLPTLTPEQQSAARLMSDEADKRPILLDGVTGSGKTEVYFHAIAQALAAHQNEGCVAEGEPPRYENGVNSAGGGLGVIPPSASQILVLLPEIALTHQWLVRFEKTFGAPPLVWHSRTTPVNRARVWHSVLNGTAQVVVGARSALFLPFSNLKLIIVDEEHDPSYKQEDGVLYHARDMAIARAHFEGAQAVLVSATPSLETMENVSAGKYRALHLAQRFGAAGMPAVRLIDLQNEPPERGDFISPAAKQAMLQTLARGEQVLFFLNRRGYAPLLLCRACGHRFECKNCSAWLVVHGKRLDEGGLAPPTPLSAATPAASGSPSATRAPKRSRAWLECHHCAHKEPMPAECPSCKAPAEKLASCGPGVERIAEEVRAMFYDAHTTLTVTLAEAPGSSSAKRDPGVANANRDDTKNMRLAVLSSDDAIAAETWEAIERGDIDILVGTQMVAKGHHFPRLTLVVVVDADVGLSGADLRAGERTYQLLHQLGGRAGRGDLPGTVLIQTYAPNHPVMGALLAQDRDRLMALEAAERRAGGWPPYGQLAAILLDGVDEAKVRAAGQMLARSAPQDRRITVLGPAPAPLSKLRGQYRYRLLIKADKSIALQATLKVWLAGQKFSGVRIKLDVNPYYFL
ncbi:MAG: primosomal protein N' [Rickettsiales bacterium]